MKSFNFIKFILNLVCIIFACNSAFAEFVNNAKYNLDIFLTPNGTEKSSLPIRELTLYKNIANFNNINLVLNTFVFNPRTLSWKALNDRGQIVKSGRASGGQKYCSDIKRSCRTPSGHFHIISKRGAECRSSRYPVGRGGAKMPYCMFFSKYYAIHGSYDLPPRNASHGCIRILPRDAYWLHKNFMPVGSRVIVQPY